MTDRAVLRRGVAAGHPVTTEAAVSVLRAGGNAFDAVVAAGFAASVAEPMLTSMAGGGFCLLHRADGPTTIADFFVDVPGRGHRGAVPPMHTIQVSFTNTTQEFHVGWGSVAVPGCLEGWLHVHRHHGRLPLSTVLAPAIGAAAAGVVVNDQQAYVFRILQPITVIEADTAARFAPGGRALEPGDLLVQPEVATFLGQLADDPDAGVATFGRALVGACAERGGAVTAADIDAYEVREVAPLAAPYRHATILTNPAPGGRLIADQLAELAAGPPIEGWDDVFAPRRFVEAQIAAEQRRHRGATKGTTHVTVVDHEGNVASMTTSNGTGSGCLVPGTGVICNNMLGEDDLFPAGRGSGIPGERVASMMSPSLVMEADQVVLALGSGGSERIRTAMTQVIARSVDHEDDLVRAVEGPRVHFDGSWVQVEPGLPAAALAELAPRRWNEWTAHDLYFGGVHAVAPSRGDRGVRAAGDPRRGGSAAVF